MANKKTVLLIRNAKSYDFGGAERYPVFLSDILQKSHNINPIIITRHPRLIDFANSSSIKTVKGWWWPNQSWNGAKVLLFPIYLLWQIILFIWYLQLFIRLKPAVIHIQSKDDFIAATWAAKILNINTIWTDHADLKHIWKNLSIWYKNPVGKLVHWSARFVNAITVISNSELSLICSNLKAKDQIVNKMRVIYNGISNKASSYSLATNDNFTYCVVSRLVTDKGIREVIEAFNDLTKEYPNDKLQIIGDGPEMSLFKEQAKPNKNIELLGYQKDPLKYIAKCDAFIHPTYHEGFSLSLLEASMLSKPIIATAIGGNTELIEDNKNGVLVKVKDVESLRNAMKLLRNDKSLRNKLGQSARKKYVDNYQFDQIVNNKFIPLYEEEAPNYEN